jgi:transposase
VLDSRTLRSSPDSGARAGYDGSKRKKGSKLHMAVDTLGHLLAAHVTPATADDRAQVGQLAQAVQVATGESVDLAYVDQGYTGEKAAAAAREHGIELEVVKLPEAKRGFVLLPRRWVVIARTMVPTAALTGRFCSTAVTYVRRDAWTGVVAG